MEALYFVGMLTLTLVLFPSLKQRLSGLLCGVNRNSQMTTWYIAAGLVLEILTWWLTV